MEDIHRKRRDKNIEDELILLFSYQKSLINTITEGDRGGRSVTWQDVGRRTWK
jgi:hypothetical protein